MSNLGSWITFTLLLQATFLLSQSYGLQPSDAGITTTTTTTTTNTTTTTTTTTTTNTTTTTTTTTTTKPTLVETFTNCIPAVSASHTINKLDCSYCQVRVDFVDFNIEGPDINGVCSSSGVLTFSPHSNGVPDICGYNIGQHVYLDFDSSNSITADVQTLDSGSRWELKFTQIPCSSAAPPDCLQYHTEPAGLIESFNFPGSLYNQKSNYQLANTHYKICLGAPGNCSQVDLQANPSFAHSFTTSGDADAIANAVPPTPPLGHETYFHNSPDAVTTSCMDADYIDIDGGGTFTAAGTGSNDVTRMCHLGFPTTGVQIPDTPTVGASPFILEIVTDGVEPTLPPGVPWPDVGNAGFSLPYSLSCPLSCELY